MSFFTLPSFFSEEIALSEFVPDSENAEFNRIGGNREKSTNEEEEFNQTFEKFKNQNFQILQDSCIGHQGILTYKDFMTKVEGFEKETNVFIENLSTEEQKVFLFTICLWMNYFQSMK